MEPVLLPEQLVMVPEKLQTIGQSTLLIRESASKHLHAPPTLNISIQMVHAKQQIRLAHPIILKLMVHQKNVP